MATAKNTERTFRIELDLKETWRTTAQRRTAASPTWGVPTRNYRGRYRAMIFTKGELSSGGA